MSFFVIVYAMPSYALPHLSHLPLLLALTSGFAAQVTTQTAATQTTDTVVLAAAGDAWTDDEHDAPLHELDALTVQGRALSDYAPAAPPSVGGPMGLTVKETAQAVSVVTEQRMKDQGLKTATDVMRWVPGVNIGSRSNSQESLTARSRGYTLDNLMVDGQPVGSTSDSSGDLSRYESVEVLRGAAGLFAGSGASGSPGGAISLVRKKPTRSAQLNLSASAGSWDHYMGSVDVGGPLLESGRVRARGIVSWTNRKFDYDFAYRKNLIAALALDVDLTADTTLTVGADREMRRYLGAQRREAFRLWDGSDPGIHKHGRSSVMPWGGTTREEYSGYVKLDHVFANHWNLKLNYTRKQYRTRSDYTNVSSSYDGDTQKIFHYMTNVYGKSKNWNEAFSADFGGDFDLLGREHKFIVGYNYQSQWSRALVNPNASERAAGGWYLGYDSTDNLVLLDDFEDYYNFDPSQYPRLPNKLDETRIRLTQPIRQSGFYGSVRLKLLDPLALTGGVRVSRYQRDGQIETWRDPGAANYLTGAYKQTRIVTPFAALSYEINERHTAHISYAEIFAPQNRYDVHGDFVSPETGSNKEIGLKSDWNQGRLSTTLTVYQVDKVNGSWIVVPSPCPILETRYGIKAACYAADNHERVRGVDVELTGQLTDNWNVSVGLSWLKTEYLKRTDNGGATSNTQGQEWSRNDPTRLLKIWSLYRLPGAAAKWRVGVGVQMQNRTWWASNSSLYYRLTDYNNNKTRVTRSGFRIDRGGYAMWNAMVSVDLSKSWQAQLNVENLTNKRYVDSFNRTSVSLNEPRNVRLTLSGRFQ